MFANDDDGPESTGEDMNFVPFSNDPTAHGFQGQQYPYGGLLPQSHAYPTGGPTGPNFNSNIDYQDQYWQVSQPQPVSMRMKRSLEPRKKLVQCLDPQQGLEYVCSQQSHRIEKIRERKRRKYSDYIANFRKQQKKAGGGSATKSPQLQYKTIHDFFKRREQKKHESR